MEPLVTIEEYGRCGSITYSSAAGHLTVSYEFGGGNCVAIIYIPEGKDWVQQTALPLAQRNMVVNYLASHVLRQKAAHCRVELQGAFLYILEPDGTAS